MQFWFLPIFHFYGYLQCNVSQLTLWTIANLFLVCYLKIGMSPASAYLSALEPWQMLLSTFRKPYSVLLGTPQSVLFVIQSEVIIQAQGFPGKLRHTDLLVPLHELSVKSVNLSMAYWGSRKWYCSDIPIAGMCTQFVFFICIMKILVKQASSCVGWCLACSSFCRQSTMHSVVSCPELGPYGAKLCPYRFHIPQNL